MLADDAARLAPLVVWPRWLSAALADVAALLVNVFRDPDKTPACHRDEWLDEWGLHVYAEEHRRAVESQRKTATAVALADFIRSATHGNGTD